MAGKNVRIAVHYKEETAQLLAAEISHALSNHIVSVTKIDVSQALRGIDEQLNSFFQNYRPTNLAGLGESISAAINAGLNTSVTASAFEGIAANVKNVSNAAVEMGDALSKATGTGVNGSVKTTLEGMATGARNATNALNDLGDAEAKQTQLHSEYVRQAQVVQRALQDAFNDRKNTNELYAGLQNIKMSVSGEMATFTAVNNELGKTVTIVGDLSTGIGQSTGNAAEFAAKMDEIARITTTLKEAPLKLTNEEAQLQGYSILESFKAASDGSASPALAGLSDWTVKVNETTAAFTAVNKAANYTQQIVVDLTEGWGASDEKIRQLTDDVGALAKVTTTLKEAPAALSVESAQAQVENLKSALKGASANGDTGILSGLTNWTKKINGTKVTFTGINTELKQSVSVTADLTKGVGDTAQAAEQFVKNLSASQIAQKNIDATYDAEEAKLGQLRSKAEQYLRLKQDILKENAPDLYNKLQDLYKKSLTPGTISAADFQKEYSAIQTQIFQTGADVQTLWQQIKSAAKIAGTFYNLYGIFNRVKRTVREMIDTEKELNQSMTQLSIVSNESLKTIESNFGNISKAAKEAGADITDLMSSMENYARMGYSMQESTDLAKLTSIYSNVGDISVDDATTSAVSILKAYNLSVNELKDTFDAMTKVDQDFAISTGDLGVAFQNTGSQLAATGTTINESIALITAANSSIQDASKTANALKTISMRLRAQSLSQDERDALAELSDEDVDSIINNSSKYRNEILGITGVDIKENESTYKSIYQIILEISKVWDHLSDTQKATLTEDIAGKRNASVLMSLINNVDDMEAAYADAEGAMGTLDAANAKYLDSIEGRQKAFQASYQSLAHSIVSSDVVGWFYDMGSGALQAAEGLQKLNLLFPLIGAGIFTLNTAIKTIKATSGTLKLFSGADASLSSAVQMLGGLSLDNQALAGMMLQGMNPAQKAQLFGGDTAATNWLQNLLLTGSRQRINLVGTFAGRSEEELKGYVEDNVSAVLKEGTEAGVKIGGKAAENAFGSFFTGLGAKIKAGLTGIRTLFTGGFGTGAAVAAWAGVAVAAGALIYNYVDNQLTKQIEAYGKLRDDISETESKIKEAQSQLDANNAAIEEYTEKKIAAGALSLTDQTTLDTLKAEQNELQVNIERWEAYAEARKQELSDTAWEALKAERTQSWKEMFTSDIADTNNYKNFLFGEQFLRDDASGIWGDHQDLWESYAKAGKERVSSGMGVWVEEHRSELDDLAYGVDDEIDEIIDAYHRFDAYILSTSGNWDSAFSTLINAPEFARTKSYLEGVVNLYGGTADNISKMAEQIKTDGAEKLNNVDLNKFLDTLEDLGFTVDRTDFTNLIMQFGLVSDAIEGLGQSTNSLTQFQSAIDGVNAEVDEWEKGEKKRTDGTKAFTSYAETYDEYIDRINRGYDIDDDLIAADVERLIGKDKIFELKGDKDAITKYIKENVKPLFDDNDSMGSGLMKRLSELSKEWEENTEGVREFRNANDEVVMSVDKSNGRWEISNDHMDEAAEKLGITTNALYALMQAVDTWGEVDKISDKDLVDNILNGNLGVQLANGRKGVTEAELRTEWTAAGINGVEQAQLLERLRNLPPESKKVFIIDTEFTGNAETDLEKLKELGVIFETPTPDVDEKGKAVYKSTVGDIEGITKLIKQSGVEFGDAWEEINQIIKDSGMSEEIYDQEVVLNSLISTYTNGTVEIKDFYNTIDAGGEKVVSIKFDDLETSLRNAGFQKETIDKILAQLAETSGVVRISGYMSWDLDPNELQSRLESMGILVKGDDGSYSIDVKALVKTTIDQGGTQADAEAAVEKIQNTLPELQLTLDTNELSSEWTKAMNSAAKEAEKTKSATQGAANAAGDMADGLSDASNNATALSGKLSDIEAKARRTASYYRTALSYADNITDASSPNRRISGATFAGGKNTDKYSGRSLVGELGPEIRATDGMVEVVGKNGPEVITIGKDDIIIPADTTEDILKKTGGSIEGIASNYGGSLDVTFSDSGSGSSSSGSSSSSSPSSSSSSSSSSAESSTEKSKDAWDRFYKNLKHQREMDQIDDAQYYAALEANYRNYLDTSEDNLDTWQSVVAEIYKGLYSVQTDAWNKELSEWDHRIAMEEASEADKLAWMKAHLSEYLSDNIQQHEDYNKALEEIHSQEYKIQTDAWDKELSEWDHRIAMEEASEADKLAWMKAHLSEYLSDNIQQHEDYNKALEEIHSQEYKIQTDAWDKELSEWDHRIAMEEASEEEKTEWMKENHEKYLSDNLTQHDDYLKAQESIFEGEVKAQTDAWDEMKNNLDHMLAMNEITEKEYWARYAKGYRETLVGNQKEVVKERTKADEEYYEAAKKMAQDFYEDLTSEATRHYQAREISLKTFLTSMVNAYKTTFSQISELDKEAVEDRQSSLLSIGEALEDNAKNNADAISAMHDLVVQQITDLKNKEIEALEETATNLEKIATLRKEAIDDLETENDYIRQQRNLQKSASQIEAELEMMKSDTSAAGMAKRRKLQEQLISAQQSLSDHERNYAVQNQKKQIDEELKQQNEEIDEKKKAIKDYLDNEYLVSNDAWARVNKAAADGVDGIKTLFDELSDYALALGKDIQDQIETTTAKFETAMADSKVNFSSAMAAYAQAGLSPMQMIEALEAQGYSFTESQKKQLASLGDAWTQESKGLISVMLQDKGIDMSVIQDATTAKQTKTLEFAGGRTGTAATFLNAFKDAGADAQDVVAALNSYFESQGKSIDITADSWEDLQEELVDSKISMVDFTQAMSDYTDNVGSNKNMWSQAVKSVDKATRSYMILSLKFGDAKAAIEALDSAYGAYEISLLASGDKIIPAVNSFATTASSIVNDETRSIQATFEAATQEIDDRWRTSRYGVLTKEQQDAAQEKLEELQDKYDLSEDTINALGNALRFGTLTMEQLDAVDASCQKLVDKYGTTAATIDGIMKGIANGDIDPKDFTTLTDKLDALAIKAGTDKDVVNDIIKKIASGEIKGEDLKSLTSITGGLDDLVDKGLASESTVNEVLGKIASGEIPPENFKGIESVLTMLATIPQGAAGAKTLTEQTLTAIASGDEIDTAALQKKVDEINEDIASITDSAIGASLSVEAIGAGKIEITEDTHDAIKARAALRAAAGLETYSAAEMAILDIDGSGEVNAIDARMLLRRGAGLKYASGTDAVPANGLYTIDEGMKDELIYDPSQNALISYLNAQSIVFPADVSDKMKTLFNNPSLLTPQIGSPSIPRMDATVNAVSVGDISMGDIIIQGNTNERTIAQIRAEQKRQAQYIGAIFEREQRFTGNAR